MSATYAEVHHSALDGHMTKTNVKRSSFGRWPFWPGFFPLSWLISRKHKTKWSRKPNGWALERCKSENNLGNIAVIVSGRTCNQFPADLHGTKSVGIGIWELLSTLLLHAFYAGSVMVCLAYGNGFTEKNKNTIMDPKISIFHHLWSWNTICLNIFMRELHRWHLVLCKGWGQRKRARESSFMRSSSYKQSLPSSTWGFWLLKYLISSKMQSAPKHSSPPPDNTRTRGWRLFSLKVHDT